MDAAAYLLSAFVCKPVYLLTLYQLSEGDTLQIPGVLNYMTGYTTTTRTAVSAKGNYIVSNDARTKSWVVVTRRRKYGKNLRQASGRTKI